MTEQLTPIEVGDRFLDRDSRTGGGRVVKVVEYIGSSAAPGDRQERRQKRNYFRVEVVEHELWPSAVGTRSRVSEYGLRNRYRKVSH